MTRPGTTGDGIANEQAPGTSAAPAPAVEARVPVLPAALFVLVWSSGYIAGPVGVRAMDPISLLAARFVLAATVAAVIARVTSGPLHVDRHAAVRTGLAGLVMNGLQFTLIYLAFDAGLDGTLGALVHSLSPVLTAILAGVLLGERLRPIQVVGFVLGVAGVLIVLGPDVGQAGGVLGITLAALSVLSLSLGTLAQRWVGTGPGALWTAAIQFAAPAPFLLVLAPIVDGLHPVHHVANALWALLYLAIVNSIVGLVLLGVIVRRGGAGASASVFFLMPPVTALLAWLTLGDTLDLREWIGIAVAAVGVAVATQIGAGRGLSSPTSRGSPAPHR